MPDKKKIIFVAYYDPDGKRVIFDVNSKHIPTLDTIVNELYYHIIELRAEAKTLEEIAKVKNVKIVSVGDNDLIKKLRGRG